MGNALFIGLQTVCTVVLLCAFVVAVLQPTFSKTTYFQLLMAAVAIYALGYLMEMLSQTYEAALVARRIQLIGIPFVGPLVYKFCRVYVDRSIRNRMLVRALFALPLVTVVFSTTWPLTNFYYTGVALVERGGLHMLQTQPGFLYYLSTIYTVITYGMGIVVIAKEFHKPQCVSSKQGLMMLVVTALPAVAGFAYLTGLTQGYNLFPAGLAVSCVVYEYFTLRYRMADWTTHARDRVLENINEAYVLLDTEYRFIDCNTLAQKYFPIFETLAAGADVRAVPSFPVPASLCSSESTEFELDIVGTTHFLRASSSPVLKKNKLLCNCIMIYDITETHQLMERLNRLATRDSLTGLYNRSTFFTIAERHFANALANRSCGAVLMLDIDFFKAVNDTYGHQCGDMVLQTLSANLACSVRESDVVGRYGGEELCIFLPITNPSGALTLAEALRKALGAMQYEWEGATFTVTVSIGMAYIDHKRHTKFEQLIADADKALYSAKSNGRDRVCVEGHVPNKALV